MLVDCPDPELLVQLGTTALGDATHDLYIEHLDGCERCRDVLRRFVKAGLDDSLTNPLSDSTGHEAFPSVPGFTIERKLGAGAAGVVYLARQDESERPVALKLIPGGHAASPRERRHWLREVKAASRVRHPHVVTLYDFGEAEPWFYLALEFIPGGSLKDRLNGPLALRDAGRLAELVALAVGKIHAENLLHLDLKPSNILIEGDENAPWEKVFPKVTDFSIARIAGDARTSLGAGMPFGTPSYMAPEQSGSSSPGQIGPASDVYALGAVLYELLTGRPPIQRNSIVETLEAIRDQPPVPPRRLNPAIPRDLEIICMKCLRKDPGRRYASAGALAEDLRRFLNGDSISARPDSSFEKCCRLVRRRPAIASLITALTLTLIGGFVGLFVLWRISEAERARVQVERANAEAARRFAEDNEKLASRALAELNDVLVFALFQPERLSENYIRETAYSLRKAIGGLKNYRGVGPLSVAGLGVVEHLLAARLRSQGKRGEARALVADSVALLKECRKLDPADENILWQLAESLWLSGTLAADEQSIDESSDFCEQAASLLDALRTPSFRMDLINRLFLMRRRLAEQLTQQNQLERARKLIEANLRMFESMDDNFASKPDLVACKEVTLADLAPGLRAIERLRAAIRRYPDDLNLRTALERRITGWLSGDAFSPNTEPGVLRTDEHDPEAWAETFVRSLRSRCSALGLGVEAVPAQGFKLVGPVTVMAVQQRKIGRLRDAERAVGRLMAFGRRLVRDYPDQFESHMVLSEAYFQVSKNAWKRKNLPAIEQALRKALESARLAATKNSQDENARNFVDRILPRLVMFDIAQAKAQ